MGQLCRPRVVAAVVTAVVLMPLCMTSAIDGVGRADLPQSETDLRIRHRLPAIYEIEPWVRDGGLMSYVPDGREIADRAAALVDRILKGAKPADLPFEQPAHFRLVINRKTADALGLVIPVSLYERADEVIE